MKTHWIKNFFLRFAKSNEKVHKKFVEKQTVILVTYWLVKK